MSEATGPELEMLSDLPELKAPPVGEALSTALKSCDPVQLRRPMRELGLFVLLSLPFIAMTLYLVGLRTDIGELSVSWLASVALVWLAGFGASAYLGFVPAKGHVSPRSRNIYQVVICSSLVLISVGLFATQSVEQFTLTYPSTIDNLVAHAGACSIFGISTGVMPGLLALVLMRRYVPIGPVSIGLSLGAAGGCLAGLALLLHCPIGERLHVGLIHGGVVVTAAVFVAGASLVLMRER